MLALRTVAAQPGRHRVISVVDHRSTHLPEVHRPQAPIDGHLLESIARGDTAAFELLYDRLAGNVLGFARHVVSCGATAERAVTRSFVEVWRRASEYDGSSDALSWVVSLCTEQLRELCSDPASS